jgi:DNA processing protein
VPTLVTDAADVIVALQPILGRRHAPVVHDVAAPDDAVEPDADARARILALLSPAPVSLDDLVRLAGSTAAIVRPCCWSWSLPDAWSAAAARWR